MSHASLFTAEVHGGRYDALTGLLNLDGFKQINDRLGHPGGDMALQQVAALLDESRLADDSFRIGGDEFALLMPKTCAEEAELAARRISQEISRIGMSDGSLGASFGVAEGAEDPAVLQAMADERLLAAKDRLYRRPR